MLKLFMTNLKLQQIRVLFLGVAIGVVCDGGSHPAAASATSHDYDDPYHPSSPSYSYYKYKVCKDREDKLLEKLEAIAEAVEELKSRRGIIPSNEEREPCTPTVEVRRQRRKIRQILFVLKVANIVTPPAPVFVKVLGPPKKVDIFAALGKDKKKELEKFIKMKVQKQYTMHSFAAKIFSNMTNMCVWYEDKYVDEILCLMRDRQLGYPDAYDAADRIMDLNFYNNFKDRYTKLYKIADSGGPRFDQLVSTFQWDEEAIKYVRGKRSYLHGKSWTKAKRILAVMTWMSHIFSLLRYYYTR
ncbi:hypothetical protein P3L10_002697 [Capsicum annuum]